MPDSCGLTSLTTQIAKRRQELAAHPLYARVRSADDLRLFMERHVFAVWDFMSLLKGLQRLLTSVDATWRPVGSASTRRLVNELVLEEESDIIDGTPIGHFEYYLDAMRQIGADTGRIERLLLQIRRGSDVATALRFAEAPEAAAAFVRTTFDFIDTGKAHVIAAAFTFGREDAIPAMFGRLVDVIASDEVDTTILTRYLHRHLELDGEDHGPKAIRMISELCGDDRNKWAEAADAAERALRARNEFWAAIAEELDERRPPPPLYAVADTLAV